MCKICCNGPSIAGADAGLVRMEPGFAFPDHYHAGDERVFIVEGGYLDETGRVYRPGDLHEMRAGTTHRFQVLPDSRLMLATVLFGPIEIGGVPVR